MAQHRSTFTVGAMSRLLEVSRSGFYDWCKRRVCRRTLTDLKLMVELLKIFSESGRTYGRPRLLAAMRRLGHRISGKRVGKLMKMAGIVPVSLKRFRVRTTDSEHALPISANLVRRNFRAAGPNQIWVSDITYVRTRRGWGYLCVILDLFSRRIVGWSLKGHMRTSLVKAALRNALDQRRVEPWSLIFHSDRGSQYCSRSFREMLRTHRIISSMSAKGDCFDNAVAESVFGTIKTERIHTREYENLAEAHADLFRYIDGFYNRRRLHSYLGFRSPEEFEMNPEAA